MTIIARVTCGKRTTEMYDPALHLFVDDYHIRSTYGMHRVFPTPEKQPEPAFEDIEGRSVAWGNVMQEPDGRFRCWYQSCVQDNVHELAASGLWGRGVNYGYRPECYPDGPKDTQISVLSYAESADGLHWVKPELGLIEWRGSARNNIVLDGAAAAEQFSSALTNLDGPCVLRDASAPDEQRYKLVSHWETIHIHDNLPVAALNRPDKDLKRFGGARGKYLMTSPDGIQWNAPLTRIKDCAAGGDYSGVVRDERNRRWWYNDRPRGGAASLGCRLAGLCSSDDLYNWPQAVEQIVFPAEFEEWGGRYQHHGMTPFNYGDQDLGYLEISIGGFPVGTVLLSHRDGERWRRVNGDTFILGLGPQGSYDDTIVNPTRNAPLAVDDRMLIPFNARSRIDCNASHFKGKVAGCMAVATLRRDGFAGMQVSDDALAGSDISATLQTQAIKVEADELCLNIEGHSGSARVALLDEAAIPIAGYGMEDCLPIDDDSVRATVRWKRADVRALAGRRVLVHIELRRGTVYAVRL